MRALTLRQREFWELNEAGKTDAEIAAALEVTLNVVRNTLVDCRRKLGVPGVPGRPLEHTKPERAAAVLDAITEPDPYIGIKEAFLAAGLPQPVSHALIRRLRVKYNGAVVAVRNLKTAEILDLLGRRIHLGLEYLDDKVFAEASARDIMLGVAAMVEKRNLLRGEPTAIVSDPERRKLAELVPLLLAEARRRGVTVEGVVTEKRVEPTEPA